MITEGIPRRQPFDAKELFSPVSAPLRGFPPFSLLRPPRQGFGLSTTAVSSVLPLATYVRALLVDYNLLPPLPRALAILRGNSSRSSRTNLRRALVRRAQAHGELGRFRLAIDDLEAAEVSFLGEAREVSPQEGNMGPVNTTLDGELVDIRKRLERARWTKVSRCLSSVCKLTNHPLFLRIGTVFVS